MTVFVIQETTMEDDFTFACLIANGYKNVIFLKYLPFVNTYVFKTKHDVDVLLKADKVVCNSGIRMLLDVAIYEQVSCMIGASNQLLDQYTTWLIKLKLREGYFYDAGEFDSIHLNLIPTIRPYLLNGSCKFTTFKKANDLPPSAVPLFIKPSSDLKWFNAGIIEPKHTFNQFINKQTTCDVLNNDLFDCGVMIAQPVADVKSMLEYRCFIVNGQFVTGSYYGLLRKRVSAPSENHTYYFQKWAQTFAEKICGPGVNRKTTTFVMDLILTDEFNIPPSIVELNCLNCSGMYMSDNMKLVEVLRDME